MAEMNVTTGDAFIPTLWENDVIRARTANYVMVPRIAHRTGNGKKGDVFRVPLVSTLAAAQMGEDGSYTPQAVTETYSDLTINKRSYVAIQLTDELETKSAYDLRKEYAPMMGAAMAQDMEDAILALYSSFTGEAEQADIDEALVLKALKTMDNSLVPDEDRHLIVCPTQYAAMINNGGFTDAAQLALKTSAVITGKLPNVYGVEVLKSTRVPTSTSRRNLLWHKSAMAIGILKKVTAMKKPVSGRVAEDIISYGFHGVVAERTDHARVLVTTNT